ncbi:hypothetical protein DID88_007104 [Monilinia fructigena]|uniref:GRIP domain-containing protein n=1 Tax=Monilinia fructigena TaxID=38457 RepID=A0A395J9Q6_9HELO|nr:hypothetical protein DID88_007104 [Monilinia fructigena]
MFQRLKAQIDTRIEEKARLNATSSTVQRSASTSSSTTRRPANQSPSRNPRRPRSKEDGDISGRGPDPADFESAFVIEDESETSTRVGTPAGEKLNPMAGDSKLLDGSSAANGSEKSTDATPRASTELPTEVRTKLRKLEKLEGRYQELLKSYRVAHARAISIEPFEKVLKENTPIGSIQEPDMLVEYLNQMKLQGDLVKDELKRVSADRDEYKKKYEESEKQNASVREELTSLQNSSTIGGSSTAGSAEKADTSSINTPSASLKSPVPSGLGISSPKQKPESSDDKDVNNEEFFSYDEEIPKLQAEIKAKSAEIDGLNSGLAKDLENVTNELNDSIKEATGQAQSCQEQIGFQEGEIQRLSEKLQEAEEHRTEVEKTIETQKKEYSENLGKLQATETQLLDLKKNLETQKEEHSERLGKLQNAESQLVKVEEALANEKKLSSERFSILKLELQDQSTKSEEKLKSALDERKEAEKRIESLNVQIKELNTLKKELDFQSDARQEAEKRIELLDVQIKELKESRETDANRIHALEKEIESLRTGEGSPRANEDVSKSAAATSLTPTPSASSKKKSKSKAKNKKAGNAAANTSTAVAAEKPPETAAPELQAEITKLKTEIADKDSQIEKLQTKRKTEEDLREEIDNLQENVLIIGQECVTAKDSINQLRAEKASLEEKVGKLEAEIKDERSRKSASDEIEKEKTDLRAQIAGIESQLRAKIESSIEAEENQVAERTRLQEERKLHLRKRLESEIEAKKTASAKLEEEKASFERRVGELESEIGSQKTASVKAEEDFKKLTSEYQDLKSKSSTMHKDLGAAEQLATSRYKELTDLKQILQNAQPELKTLRAENASLKSIKDELNARTADLRRLEAREKDLKGDLASFKKQAADRDGEIRSLNEKFLQEKNGRLRAEDQARVAQRDLRKSEAEKIQLAAAGRRLVSNLSTETKGLREEVELRGSQYNNAQGLLGSMRDQQAEITVQLRESKEQSESLTEELAEVQRLLVEQTRQAETMRKIVADVNDEADVRIRGMKERMESAIAERDRAEEEASTNARRRSREVDGLKTRIKDFERDIKRATDNRDELEQSQREFKRRREELENAAEKSAQEVSETRSAMSELRNALDGSEKQLRDAEKSRADVRKLLDEANQRYEKLQKDFKALQMKNSRLHDVSSRSSIDSGRSKSPNGAAQTDTVYTKTVLLQFLQQKDKKIQQALVNTVIGQLLHLDKGEQEKWIAAISTWK